MNTDTGDDILTIAIIMIMVTIMYNTKAHTINDTTHSNIGIIIIIELTMTCLGWFALLWRRWLKIIQNNPQVGGSFASANRFALLSWLVCSSVEGVAKDYSKQPPRGWELCFGESVCSFVLVGLLFCGGGG
jgi:hypothetical protein